MAINSIGGGTNSLLYGGMSGFLGNLSDDIPAYVPSLSVGSTQSGGEAAPAASAGALSVNAVHVGATETAPPAPAPLPKDSTSVSKEGQDALAGKDGKSGEMESLSLKTERVDNFSGDQVSVKDDGESVSAEGENPFDGLLGTLSMDSSLLLGGLLASSPVDSLLGADGSLGTGPMGFSIDDLELNSAGSPENAKQLGYADLSGCSKDVQDLAAKMIGDGVCSAEDITILQVTQEQGADVSISEFREGGLLVGVTSPDGQTQSFRYDAQQAKGLIIAGGSGNDNFSTDKNARPDMGVMQNFLLSQMLTDQVTTPLHIAGGAGDDVIRGGQGNDLIFGGEGKDYIEGGAGDDYIDGGAGDDVIYGGPGNDTIFGREGNDYIDGGAGDDYIDGGEGNDILSGGLGDDTIFGGDGDDVLIGGRGHDSVHGGAGHDRIIVGETEQNTDSIYADENDNIHYVEPKEVPSNIRVSDYGVAGGKLGIAYEHGVEASSGFASRVNDDLQTMSSLDEGQQLFDAIAATGKTVDIVEYDGDNLQESNASKAYAHEDGSRNDGSDSRILYNTATREIYGGRLSWSSAPPVLGLAHEMSHAYNAALGNMDGRQMMEEAHDGSRHQGFNAAEYQAVGIRMQGIEDNPTYATENGWREALNLPARNAYTGIEESKTVYISNRR